QQNRQQRLAKRPNAIEPPQEVYTEPVIHRKKTQIEKAEELLLYRLFNEEGFNQRFKNYPVNFPHENYQELYLLFDTYLATEVTFDVARFLDFLQKEELRQLVIQIASLNVPKESNEQELQDLLRMLQKSTLLEEIQEKRLQQQMAS